MELFFKWLKQHLRIKAFYGTSENAVKTQLWIAVSASLFEKTQILQALSCNDITFDEEGPGKQLALLIY